MRAVLFKNTGHYSEYFKSKESFNESKKFFWNYYTHRDKFPKMGKTTDKQLTAFYRYLNHPMEWVIYYDK